MLILLCCLSRSVVSLTFHSCPLCFYFLYFSPFHDQGRTTKKKEQRGQEQNGIKEREPKARKILYRGGIRKKATTRISVPANKQSFLLWFFMSKNG
ncbi:hypothetical protein BKA57DRAFT_137591 [Linnemannia elongata]|nr:hypothetical protein BKA57DRAFT_137591 [Linnemannia elongata]